jgi:hypothetical protein
MAYQSTVRLSRYGRAKNPGETRRDGIQADGIQADGIQTDGIQADGIQADGIQAEGIKKVKRKDSTEET